MYPHNENMAGDASVLLAQLSSLGDNHEDVDISSTDHTATMTDCRAITCTSGNTIKVDYLKGDGVNTGTAILPASLRLISIRNVTKVYKTGTDAANIILWR